MRGYVGLSPSHFRCAISVILLSVSGCIGGSDRTCGQATNGQACETDEECACGLTCSTVCTEVFGQPNQPVAEPNPASVEPTFEQMSLARSYCDAILALPCAPEEERDQNEACIQDMSTVAQRADQDNCGSQFRNVLRCAISNARCTDDRGQLDRDHLEMMCQSQLEAFEACSERCENQESSYCSPRGDFGDGCITLAQSSCETGSSAECETIEDDLGTRWRCTCTVGLREGHIFDVYSDACCDVSNVVIKACGAIDMDPDVISDETDRISSMPMEPSEVPNP